MNDSTLNDLEIFKSLKGIKVVFDVGARDTEYHTVRPDVTYHYFEPNPEFFNELPTGKNYHVNNYGLGNKAGKFKYIIGSQSFEGSECIPKGNSSLMLQVKTLNWYIKKNNIKRIDFLKIDTEGMDYQVLQGGKKAIELAKYIQVEYWNDASAFNKILNDFTIEDVGFRNLLCKRKK